MNASQLIKFWRQELAEAQRALDARNQSVAIWQGGTDAAWRAVGCSKNKAARMLISAREARIANKCRKRISAIEATLDLIMESNNAD